MEEISCKVVPKPEKSTKTVIGGGDKYGERPLFVGQGSCNLILIDNFSENTRLVNVVLKCPGCQEYNELPD